MAVHRELTPAEAGDRLALRELIDAYAHCADRRDAEGQKALFTADTRFGVYMDGEGSEPTYVLDGREALTPVFADLNSYESTTHFDGQSTVSIEGDRATGESYTIAHHLFSEAGERKIMIASLRYLDTFAKIDGGWYLRRAEAPPRLERDAAVAAGDLTPDDTVCRRRRRRRRDRGQGGTNVSDDTIGRDQHGFTSPARQRTPNTLLETDIPGVLAAGDVRSGSTKRRAHTAG